MIISICGESSTGKTTSFENLDPEITCFIVPNNKVIPFKGFTDFDSKTNTNGNVFRAKNFEQVNKISKYILEKRPHVKNIIVDDTTHLIYNVVNSQEFKNRKSGGDAMAKWADLGTDLHVLVNGLNIPSDVIYVLVYHIQPVNKASGLSWELQGEGNVIRKLNLTSWVDMSFQTKMPDPYDAENPDKQRYWFVTNNDGSHNLARTRKNLFPMYIPNDFQKIIEAIKNDKYEE